jgi:hypothetical protein
MRGAEDSSVLIGQDRARFKRKDTAMSLLLVVLIIVILFGGGGGGYYYYRR